MPNTNSPFVSSIVSGEAWHQFASEEGGRVRNLSGDFEVTDNDFDAVGDTIVLAVLPSHARPLSIKIGNDDLDGAVASVIDVGIYNWITPGTLGTAVDDDVFASSRVSFQTATPLTEYLDEGATAITFIGARLWEWAVAASDPGGFYAIVIVQNATVASAQTGTVSFVMKYAMD